MNRNDFHNGRVKQPHGDWHYDHHMKTPHDEHWPWYLTLMLAPLAVFYVVSLVALSVGAVVCRLLKK
jgi:hypothetical protein